LVYQKPSLVLSSRDGPDYIPQERPRSKPAQG